MACLWPAILSCEFLSIQGVASVGGGTSQDPWIVDKINRCITTMLLIISKLSFIYTMLCYIYSALIHFAFSHIYNYFVLITCRLFKSWQEAAALLHHLLLIPTPREADDLFMTRISTTVLVWYPTTLMILKMTIQNLTMSLFGDHPGQQLASGNQKIPSCQYLENELRQLK